MMHAIRIGDDRAGCRLQVMLSLDCWDTRTKPSQPYAHSLPFLSYGDEGGLQDMWLGEESTRLERCKQLVFSYPYEHDADPLLPSSTAPGTRQPDDAGGSTDG